MNNLQTSIDSLSEDLQTEYRNSVTLETCVDCRGLSHYTGKLETKKQGNKEIRKKAKNKTHSLIVLPRTSRRMRNGGSANGVLRSTEAACWSICILC